MAEFLVWFLLGCTIIVALPLQLLGLPGTWLLVLGAFLFRYVRGPGLVDYHTVLILLFMAVLAEALELLTAVHGARSDRPVRGAGVAAVAGAFAGGLAGAPILFGLGAIPGMALGAWMAVFFVAVAGGATFTQASRTALGAMTGRIKGTALKIIVAVGMVAVLLISLVF